MKPTLVPKNVIARLDPKTSSAHLRATARAYVSTQARQSGILWLHPSGSRQIGAKRTQLLKLLLHLCVLRCITDGDLEREVAGPERPEPDRLGRSRIKEFYLVSDTAARLCHDMCDYDSSVQISTALCGISRERWNAEVLTWISAVTSSAMG